MTAKKASSTTSAIKREKKEKTPLLYKLTTQDMKTRVGYSNETQWEIGKTVSVSKKYSSLAQPKLCTKNVIHCYENPLIAVLRNPNDANIQYPRLFTASGIVVIRDKQLKVGCKSLTLVREIPVPVFTTNQKVYFAILCALAVYKESSFVKWAKNWILNKDRTSAAAYAAAYAAYAAAYAAYAAAYAAGNAAAYTIYAAYAAAAADTTATATAAYVAAATAATACPTLDLFKLARKALKFESSEKGVSK
jgi:hypothetical protein